MFRRLSVGDVAVASIITVVGTVCMWFSMSRAPALLAWVCLAVFASLYVVIILLRDTRFVVFPPSIVGYALQIFGAAVIGAPRLLQEPLPAWCAVAVTVAGVCLVAAGFFACSWRFVTQRA